MALRTQGEGALAFLALLQLLLELASPEPIARSPRLTPCIARSSAAAEAVVLLLKLPVQLAALPPLKLVALRLEPPLLSLKASCCCCCCSTRRACSCSCSICLRRSPRAQAATLFVCAAARAHGAAAQ